MFFIACAFKGQVHVFAGRVKIVSHSSSRTSAILKYFCPLNAKKRDKDKEALFNVAYIVTDNISSRAILRHNNYIFNRYLPALLYLPITTPFMRVSARELLVPFFTPLVWCGGGIRTHDLPLRKRTLYQLSYRCGLNEWRNSQVNSGGLIVEDMRLKWGGGGGMTLFFTQTHISSSDLKSRPTLIHGHFCLHDVVRETLHCACVSVGKRLLQRNLVYPAVKVKILRFKQVTSAKLFQTCSYLHFLLFPNISI